MLDVWQGFGGLLSCVEVGVVLALLTKGFSCLGQCCFDIAVRDDFERSHVFLYDSTQLWAVSRMSCLVYKCSVWMSGNCSVVEVNDQTGFKCMTHVGKSKSDSGNRTAEAISKCLAKKKG